MKFPTPHLVLPLVALCMLTFVASASAKQLARTDQITIIDQGRLVNTSSRRKTSRLVSIRNDAIRESMIRLQELRPYTSNYRGLRRAVRRYWHHNIKRPSARRLTAVIMPYVSVWVRGIAYPKVLAHSQNGVRRVKRALGGR